MFADQLRAAIEAASRITLPQVTALLWRAYGDGQISEAEAEALSGLIEARTASAPGRRQGLHPARANPSPAGLSSPDPASSNVGQGHIPGASADAGFPGIAPQDRYSSPRRPGAGSRPRTGASMERRRRWAASGRLPPGIASRFTLAEQAVLALVAAETARRGDCRLAHEHVAALCGVSRSTVKNAMREARKLGLVTVEERPVTGFRNLPNIVRIVAREWLAWLRLARKGMLPRHAPAGREGHHGPSLDQGGGVNSATRTHTQVPRSGKTGPTDSEKGCRQAAGDLDRSGPSRIRAGGGAGRAMR